MTATEKLRALLDERGVEYDLLDESIAHLTMWQTCYEGLRHECQFDECHGESKLEIWDCTPEQAIAAMLGRGTCEWQCEKHGPLYDVYSCSVCKYEYAESRTDRGATDLVPNYCPNCGAKVVDK